MYGRGCGGTAKDICDPPGDFCKMQTQSTVAMGGPGTCSSDDDCKAGSGTGARAIRLNRINRPDF